MKTLRHEETMEVPGETIQFRYQDQFYSERIDNFQMRDMSISEIKDALNELPSKFAYWKAMESTVSLQIEDLERDFEVWYADKYLAVDEQAPSKSTEAWKKNTLVVQHERKYREMQDQLHQLRAVYGKVHAIVKAIDMQSWTLRSIAGLTQSEMANLEPRATGRGNLSDL